MTATADDFGQVLSKSRPAITHAGYPPNPLRRVRADCPMRWGCVANRPASALASTGLRALLRDDDVVFVATLEQLATLRMQARA